MDWKQYYVKKLSGKVFDLEEVKTVISNVIVKPLNLELHKSRQKQIEINSHEVVMPDCTIRYQIEQDKLLFNKFDLDGNLFETNAIASIYLENGQYGINQFQNQLYSDLFEAIEGTFCYLLTGTTIMIFKRSC